MNSFHARSRTSITALLLLTMQILTPCVGAQTSPAPNKLFITVLEGEGALNDTRGRIAREPIVQVEDENHKPVAGALIIFSTPGSGASGTFANGLNTFTTTTLADGRAVGAGFQPNAVAGSYQVQVQASVGQLHTVAVIDQTNIKPVANSTSVHAAHALPVKVVLIGAAVVAGGIGAALLATRGGGHSDTITAGTPTIAP